MVAIQALREFAFNVLARNPLISIEDRDQRVDGICFVLVKSFHVKIFVHVFVLLFLFGEA